MCHGGDVVIFAHASPALNIAQWKMWSMICSIWNAAFFDIYWGPFMARFAVWIGLFGSVLLLQSAPQPAAQTESLWIAFRYAPGEVISHVAQLVDPVPIPMQDVKDPGLPLTRDSVCGYPLPLLPERLRTFSPNPESVPVIGRRLTLLTGGNARLAVTVDRYIETWQGDPHITVAIIAKISPNDLARFRNVLPDYFLLSTANQPALPEFSPPESPARATRSTLNRFDVLGDIIERRFEAGWDITLYRMNKGAMQPTRVSFGCGD
jgi:hypothetical protein